MIVLIKTNNKSHLQFRSVSLLASPYLDLLRYPPSLVVHVPFFLNPFPDRSRIRSWWHEYVFPFLCSSFRWGLLDLTTPAHHRAGFIRTVMGFPTTVQVQINYIYCGLLNFLYRHENLYKNGCSFYSSVFLEKYSDVYFLTYIYIKLERERAHSHIFIYLCLGVFQ